ncbi:MAG: DUF116 domain-containing protein [Endomicrobiales bacterium]
MFDCTLFRKTSEEANRRIASKKNERMAKAFAAVPFGERIVFVPHCMRDVEKCRAKEAAGYYLCAECGACKVGPISKKTKALGYRGLYILKGGKVAEKLAAELKPRAMVGVACFFEGVQGIKLGEKNRIIVQFVPLSKDGCAATDVVLEEVFKVLAQE